MTTGDRHELAEIIKRLSSEAVTAASPLEAREAAARTGGIPVYADMGGILVVAPDGSVLHYDPDNGQVSPVREDCWRIVALVKAARKFPELRQLQPRKPDTASTCAQCGGEGVVFGNIDCGVCWGTGWTVNKSS
jgi:hypothetical protein